MIKKYSLIITIILLLTAGKMQAQFLMDMVDTTKDMGKNMLSLYNRFDRIRISGYIQPQYQIADTAGAKSFEGGDFSQFSNNRFMLRRGRIRFDYVRYTKQNDASVQFVFQFDGTERGVFIRDFWGRVFDHKWQLFSGTVGMFARPFGFETNLSSADRESPERGRMNQILMKTERDLGMMISFEPRKRKNFLQYIKYDIGIFNGQGLTATTDFDSKKDIITRFSLKSVPLNKKMFLSAGVSYLHGGVRQNSKYRASVQNENAVNLFVNDSLGYKAGSTAPRTYMGADAQLKIKHGWGATEFRAEFISGTQTSTSSNTETPGTNSADTTQTNVYYVRKFSGAYFYFLQNIINKDNQLILKYDWYDPNTLVKGSEIGLKSSNLKAAEIKYSTFGIGFLHHFNENMKVVLYYDFVKNERTGLTGYTRDVKDNVLTTRVQFRF
jgi:hypothetical protein